METIKVKNGYRLTADETMAILGCKIDGLYYKSERLEHGEFYIAKLKRKSTKPKVTDFSVTYLEIHEIEKSKITKGKRISWNSRELVSLTEEYFANELAEEKQLLITDDSNRYFYVRVKENYIFPTEVEFVLYETPNLASALREIVKGINLETLGKLNVSAYMTNVKRLAKDFATFKKYQFTYIDDAFNLAYYNKVLFNRAYNLQVLHHYSKFAMYDSGQ